MENIKDIANQLIEAVKPHGWKCDEVKGSELSNSIYITFTYEEAGEPDEYGPVEMYGECIRVRISDHELPPTYGQLNGWPTYEVGPHGSAHVDGLEGVIAAMIERAKNQEVS